MKGLEKMDDKISVNVLEESIISNFPSVSFWEFVCDYQIPQQELHIYLELLFEQGKLPSREGIPFTDEEHQLCHERIKNFVSLKEIAKELHRPLKEMKALIEWQLIHVSYSKIAVRRAKKIYMTEKILKHSKYVPFASEIAELLGHSEKSAKRDIDFIYANSESADDTTIYKYLESNKLKRPKKREKDKSVLKIYLKFHAEERQKEKRVNDFKDIWNKRAKKLQSS